MKVILALICILLVVSVQSTRVKQSPNMIGALSAAVQNLPSILENLVGVLRTLADCLEPCLDEPLTALQCTFTCGMGELNDVMAQFQAMAAQQAPQESSQ